ncbi:MAG TPA: hypothetical protein VGN37_03280 [Actinocatenispora sp.]
MEPLEPRCPDCGSPEVDVLHTRPHGAEVVCHDCGWIGWIDTATDPS